MKISVSRFLLIRKYREVHGGRNILQGLWDVTAVTKALQKWDPNFNPQNENDMPGSLVAWSTQNPIAREVETKKIPEAPWLCWALSQWKTLCQRRQVAFLTIAAEGVLYKHLHTCAHAHTNTDRYIHIYMHMYWKTVPQLPNLGSVWINENEDFALYWIPGISC